MQVSKSRRNYQGPNGKKLFNAMEKIICGKIENRKDPATAPGKIFIGKSLNCNFEEDEWGYESDYKSNSRTAILKFELLILPE